MILVERSRPERTRNKKKEDKLARTASIYFIRASKDCPASVNGQAARIALSARRDGFNPSELQDALLGDFKCIGLIRDAADKTHQRRSAMAGSIERGDVKEMVTADFERAGLMLDLLTDEQLAYIGGELFYESRAAHGDLEGREEMMYEVVDRMIKRAESSREL